MNKRIFILLIGTLTLALFSMSFVLAAPNGANVSHVSTTSASSGNPSNYSAYAGNVTELTVTGLTTTSSWQGYYGNVSGVIQLANSGGNVMYNWSQANPTGEVYASMNGTIAWSYIQCFNYTANGTYCPFDNGLSGATSLCGMNLTQLETTYNINVSDVDAVNNTFSASDHAQFYTNNKQFSPGECKNIKIYNSTGQGLFDEALLYEPTGRSVIFASVLQADANGFDGNTHDFEMLVLDDGHSGDTNPTNYYFYMEIA
jgi:hypothetical protein